MLTFEQKLRNYADVALQIGIGLQAGQRLLITAPIGVTPLVHLLVERAYQLGARLVDVVWDDDEVLLKRFQHAPKGSFGEVSAWKIAPYLEYAKTGDPVLAIRATDPNLLSGQDPESLTTYQKAHAQTRKPYLDMVQVNAFAWNLIAAPVAGWADKIFPNDDRAIEKLWDAIFMTTRADQADPIAAWREHIANLDKRAKHLNQKQYTAVRFKGSKTDLTLGLPENHLWEAAGGEAQTGQVFVANLPTEEVFTLPHKDKANGIVYSTKPLSHQGRLIDNFSVRFENGKVVEVQAEQGLDALKAIIATDEGAARLGEVALVETSSPIHQSGLFFYHTLFDENAVSHIALGSAYRFNLQGGTTLSTEEFASRGGNDSLIHVDFMIGSEDIDVYGITANGSEETIISQGRFVI